MDTVVKRVWVGDLCYVISDKNWDKMCDEMEADAEGKNTISYSTDKLSLCRTYYGDGCYHGIGHSYPVDSGTLGVIWEDEMDDYVVSHVHGRFFPVNVNVGFPLPRLFADFNDVSGDVCIFVGRDCIETIQTNTNYDEDDEDNEYDDDSDSELYYENDDDFVPTER